MSVVLVVLGGGGYADRALAISDRVGAASGCVSPAGPFEVVDAGGELDPARSWAAASDALGGPGPTPAEVGFVVAVPDGRVRASVAAAAPAGFVAVTLVDPTATVSTSATLGPGCVVGPDAYVGPGVVLGAHGWCGEGAVLEAGAKLGAEVTIATGAIIGTGAVVGRGARIGAGAVVEPGVNLRHGALVEAAAVVRPQFAAG